jgi:UDP-glucose 4-epimerase
VNDCVDAITTAVDRFDEKVKLVHIGNKDHISVLEVAHHVCEVMGLKNVQYRFTGGKRGWVGDALTNFMSCNSLDSIGWKPEYDSASAVREAAKRLIPQI